MAIIGEQVHVAVVGATGLAGQQFLAALASHPAFKVMKLAASSRSAGKPYIDAIRSSSGQIAWYADAPLDERIARIQVEEAEALDPTSVGLVFSCVESGPARELEPVYAKHTPVLSTASAFRREPDVPLMIPGVNLDHSPLIDHQRRARGWKGFVVPNANCTTVGLAVTLAPLHRRFGVERATMVSMQAVSGAGRSPGVIAMDVIDNIIPYIPGEEEKVEWETNKILGTLAGESVEPAGFGIAASCTRVGTLEGHFEVVHVQLSKPADERAIRSAWAAAGAEIAGNYPTAPERFIQIEDDPFRPQVRIDRDAGGGMTTVVGRLRPDPTVENGFKYMLVSHNTKMGAAQGCILVAEYLHDKGYIPA